MPSLTHLVLIALAGAVGTLLRAGCTALATKLIGVGFPWGTLAVNVAGSLAFGVIYGLCRSRTILSPAQETVILVGLLGGFTTYSSFAFQSAEMLASGRGVAALAYVVGTNLAGVGGISFPCGFTKEGLPIGFQLQAPPLGEPLLLRAADRFQRLTDWHRRRPTAPGGAPA